MQLSPRLLLQPPGTSLLLPQVAMVKFDPDEVLGGLGPYGRAYEPTGHLRDRSSRSKPYTLLHGAYPKRPLPGYACRTWLLRCWKGASVP